MVSTIVNALLAVSAGVGISLVVFYLLDRLATLLPGAWSERIRPYVYIVPAFGFLSLYLIYPAVQTVVNSFANSSSSAFVGFANYRWLLQSPDFRLALVNTVLWVLVVPVACIVVGLAVATVADRLRPGAERLAKTVIFVPMAISGVGAGVIWRLVYAANPEGSAQIGLLNGLLAAFGQGPVNWLEVSQYRLNSILLMVVLMWMQAGFAMVLLSAAIKGVPVDTLEAARIDGASEGQIFRRVIVPQIWGTIVTVWVTVTIAVMKIFDVVYVMTNGSFRTDVVANQFYNQLGYFQNGYASSIVVLLMIAIIPVLIYQIRQFRVQESLR